MPPSSSVSDPVDLAPTGLQAFREFARAWLAAHAESPAGLNEDELIIVAKRYQSALADAGLACLTWPRRYGGAERGAAEQRIFAEESSAYELPVAPFLINLGMSGPTLLDLGSDDQKERYLRPLIRGEEVWCQLFSEPAAGSDVAGLRSRATATDDGWVVSGQKVWTSRAQWADFGALLARTDPDVPKHKGLTMFIVDMRAPGVTVRPLRDMSGGKHFNEVFFDQVHLPEDSVIGEVGGGWKAAVTMLGHERVSIGARGRAKVTPLMADQLWRAAIARSVDSDPLVSHALTELWVQQHALSLFNTRLQQQRDAGTDPGSKGSISKLTDAVMQRRAVEVAGLIYGPEIIAFDPASPADGAIAELIRAINVAPSASIAGGTDQIQRSIIGERVLGLPKEPAVDRDVPFNQINGVV